MLGASGNDSRRDTPPPTWAQSTGSPAGRAAPTDQRPRTRTRPVSAPEGSHSTASSVRPSRIDAGMDSVTASDAARRIGGGRKHPLGAATPPPAAIEGLVGVALGDEQADHEAGGDHGARDQRGRNVGGAVLLAQGDLEALPHQQPEDLVEHAFVPTRRRSRGHAAPSATAATRSR